MADIAILVAEVYERRMGHTADSRSASAVFDLRKLIPAKMTVGIDKMKFKSLMKKLEAKSEFSLAISHGFFSA